MCKEEGRGYRGLQVDRGWMEFPSIPSPNSKLPARGRYNGVKKVDIGVCKRVRGGYRGVQANNGRHRCVQ